MTDLKKRPIETEELFLEDIADMVICVDDSTDEQLVNALKDLADVYLRSDIGPESLKEMYNGVKLGYSSEKTSNNKELLSKAEKFLENVKGFRKKIDYNTNQAYA